MKLERLVLQFERSDPLAERGLLLVRGVELRLDLLDILLALIPTRLSIFPILDETSNALHFLLLRRRKRTRGRNSLDVVLDPAAIELEELLFR